MTNRVIVTLVDERSNVGYDLELPLDQKCADLIDDIAQTLMGCNSSLYYEPEYMSLRLKRTGKILNRKETIRQACVWTGDILEFIPRV